MAINTLPLSPAGEISHNTVREKVNETITVVNDNQLTGRIVVNSAVDLSGVIDGTKEYFINGVIDMGTQEIAVGAGGINLTGYNFEVSKLISSSAGYTMLSGATVGSILIKDLGVEVTGTGSQMNDCIAATGNESFEISRVSFNDCTSLGTLSGFRQGLEVATRRLGGTPELTLDGSWAGGYFIDTSIVRGLTDGVYSVYKAGGTFSMSSRFRSNHNIDLPASASFIDFAPSNFVNPSILQLEGCLISRDGVFDASDTNIMPNTTPAELTSKWKSNDGIMNTFEGGKQAATTEIETTISVIDTFVDLAGTFTATGLQHFDAPANGQLRHLGSSPIEYSVTGQTVIEGTSGDSITLKLVIWRDASSGFEDGPEITRVVNSLQGARDVAYFVGNDSITLNQNDYIKIQVANASSTDNVTAELDSYLVVSAR